MSLFRLGRPSLRLACSAYPNPLNAARRPAFYRLRGQIQTRLQHNDRRKTPPEVSRQEPTQWKEHSNEHVRSPNNEGRYSPEPETIEEILGYVPRVRYLRPAIWAVLVSTAIYVDLAYLEAKEELKPRPVGGWLQVPQWNTPNRGPPGPIEVVTREWESLNPITKLSYGIIGVNSAVHLGSMVMPNFFKYQWHLPVSNRNYTLFTSMFVHGGGMHLFFNMYCVYNFLLPCGYSRVFEGSPYHTLSFFLATGILSGFAQHWSTMFISQKRAVPEILIRCGGASGALLGIVGVFCMQYPNAGLGIMFVPVHFDAQYVLPAIMAFDFIGMVRGYSFVNFGHAAHLAGTLIGVAYSHFDGKTHIWKPLVRFWKRRLQNQA